jgi:hypothetical protein
VLVALRESWSPRPPGIVQKYDLISVLSLLPDRNGVRPAEPPAGRRRTMKLCELQDHQALPHPPPILQTHLHIARSDHLDLPWDSLAAHQSRRGPSLRAKTPLHLR